MSFWHHHCDYNLLCKFRSLHFVTEENMINCMFVVSIAVFDPSLYRN